MPRIPLHSLQNPRVKQVVRLRRAQHRQRERLMLIDGAREIERAVDGGYPLQALFCCPELCRSDAAQALLRRAEELAPEVFDVTRQVFAKLAFGDREEGLVAVASLPLPTLADLPIGPDSVIAVLEGVEKPGNLGAVLRSADAAGVTAVVAADYEGDLFNPNAIRASLGAIFHLPLAAASTQETLAWLRAAGVTIYAARLQEAADYRCVPLAPPVAIALGSEAHGLSSAWCAPDIRGVCLPMRGRADSLNVANTASVLFYEALRQREAE